MKLIRNYYCQGKHSYTFMSGLGEGDIINRPRPRHNLARNVLMISSSVAFIHESAELRQKTSVV